MCLTVILAERRRDSRRRRAGDAARHDARHGSRAAALVNLERPLRADGRFGGHFVQGHVDAVGYVEELRADADFHWLTVSFPSQLAPYIVHKGSIAVDGISLTVAGLGTDRFDVRSCRTRWSTPISAHRAVRDRVNLECDMVGKYVVRAAELAGLTLNGVRPGEVTH